MSGVFHNELTGCLAVASSPVALAEGHDRSNYLYMVVSLGTASHCALAPTITTLEYFLGGRTSEQGGGSRGTRN